MKIALFNNFDQIQTVNIALLVKQNIAELFDAIKNNKIKFSEIKNKQNEFLNKLSNMKIGKKNYRKKKVISNLKKFYNSREEVVNFFRDYTEMLFNARQIMMQNKMKLKEQDLKY